MDTEKIHTPTDVRVWDLDMKELLKKYHMKSKVDKEQLVGENI